MLHLRRPVAAIAAASIAFTSAAAQRSRAADPLEGLDGYIQQAMRAWQGAGLSIAIVKDDSVVFAKCYCVREAGKPAAVDANTVFAIGSNSNLFTAVRAGTLV